MSAPQSLTLPPEIFFPRIKSRSPGFLMLSTALSILMATAVVWVMQHLINIYEAAVAERTPPYTLDVVRVIREETPPPERTPKVERDNHVDLPDAPDLPPWKESGHVSGLVATNPNLKPDFGADAKGVIFIPDGGYIAQVESQPAYPRAAIEKGIEGYCVVTYTIAKTGMVKDVVVETDNCTSRYFYSASIKAASRFKYKPRIVDGQAVDTPQVRKKFVFDLE